MGQFTYPNLPDKADQVVTGSVGSTTTTNAVALKGRFNLSLWGTFVATVALQRSFDGGATWISCSNPDGTNISFTSAISVVCDEPERGVIYRLNVAWTSGTVNWRFSQ